MSKPIVFPRDERFVEDLILQRTEEFVKHGGGVALERWFADGDRSQLVACLKQQGLLEAFVQETAERLRAEAEELANALQAPLDRSAVSVGPGNGLLELFLFRRLRFSTLLLIDIEDTESHVHGFSQHGSGYASLAATKDFLVANGVPSHCILTCNPRREVLPKGRFDLLISILSMGFHYPCDEYVDFILDNVSEGGRVVLDKRRGATDKGYERLHGALVVQAERRFPKFDRLVLLQSQSSKGASALGRLFALARAFRS
jgi:hypothetical protein